MNDDISFGSCFLNHISALKVTVDKLGVRVLFCDGLGPVFVADIKSIVVVWVSVMNLGKGSSSNET